MINIGDTCHIFRYDTSYWVGNVIDIFLMDRDRKLCYIANGDTKLDPRFSVKFEHELVLRDDEYWEIKN